ncbi:hypothetical protein IFM89_032611 [Coptis chinensis]|uniref:Phytocyanin domain-containing protein n=1 Tax=Coptis chinensis TaxID=261450 RepID=A0A835M807_9MAGN|nr:hypothetical protein IFM89_032611 [Coptis chinensis]
MASKCGVSYAQGLIILVTASMLAVGHADTIVVGGAENWHFGFNYTNWAFQNSPLYLNDTLVFKYDPPNGTTFPHSVYLLRDFRSFLRCDLRRAKQVASVTQGGGEGFKFVMKRWQPYYFACGERAGFHCKVGLMKFAVMPLPRCHIW